MLLSLNINTVLFALYFSDLLKRSSVEVFLSSQAVIKSISLTMNFNFMLKAGLTKPNKFFIFFRIVWHSPIVAKRTT